MNQDTNFPHGLIPAESLTEVLGQTEHVKDLVEQSAWELSTINTSLEHQIAQEGLSSSLQTALRNSQAVEEKVQDASEKLAVLTRALAVEVNQRQDLDLQLAAMTEQEVAARHAALHDALTGLANRSLFNDRLEHALAQAKRHGLTLAVMFLDLDGFKAVNDEHGHEVGDTVLQQVADRLRENTREVDTVSRMGGDEFLYLVMGATDTQDVTKLAQKIGDCVQVPYRLSVGTLSVKLSIGIARFPEDGDTADALVKQADLAMYKAKRDRSEYVFAS